MRAGSISRLTVLVSAVVIASVLLTDSAQARPLLATADSPPPVTQGDPGFGVGKGDAVGEALAVAVPVEDRAEVLGGEWAGSTDFAWTVTGDATGLHVLVGAEAEGFAWRSVATLSRPGLESARWIGNACLTGSKKYLVVVYGPREFINDVDVAGLGGLVSVVDVSTGVVTDIPVTASMAYFNPGCGAGDTAVLTQEGAGESQTTRLLRLDAATGVIESTTEVADQVTSAVPVPGSVEMLGVVGSSVARIGPDGSASVVAGAAGIASRLISDPDGGVVFMDTAEGGSSIQRVSPDGVSVIAEGAVGQIDVMATTGEAGTTDEVVVLGEGIDVSADAPVWAEAWPVSADAVLSSEGTAAVIKTVSREDVPPTLAAVRQEDELEADVREVNENVPPGEAGVVGVQVALRDTEETVDLLAVAQKPDADIAPAPASDGPTLEQQPGQRLVVTSGLLGAAGPLRAASVTDTTRACAVPRNDPGVQVYQPTPRQVEWAVDQAVQNNLNVLRPTNWRNSGLPSWRPQTRFPPRTLTGGGRIPASILLGVLAQESNLRHASWHAVPGVTGNPLVGNYYGVGADGFTVNFANADCGYGAAQVTDGMRLGTSGLATADQTAIAVDYASNIARGQQILADKWNEMRAENMVLNNGDIAKPENWFLALWAYNSGFRPRNYDNTGAYGLLWSNNPGNSRYDANRTPFMDYIIGGGARDGATPGKWPYPERVLGWASYSQGQPEFTYNDNGTPVTTSRSFNPASWNGAAPEVGLPYSDRIGALSNGVINRLNAKPPVFTFCTAANACVPGSPGAGGTDEKNCNLWVTLSNGTKESRCWWHSSATWKTNCVATCGVDSVRFDTTYTEPGDGIAYRPNCSPAGMTGVPRSALPARGNAVYIVDDVSPSTPKPRCGSMTSRGTFSFAPGSAVPGVDIHQIGAGYGDHFWFTHMRNGPGLVRGVWNLGMSLNTKWVRVLVHVPDHGAYTQNARYKINLGNGSIVTRSVLQQTGSNAWQSLGVVQMKGTPTVSLDNIAGPRENTGDVNVAYDAVAFEVLPAKPRDFVVALGDSYSSGEGAGDYYPETNEGGTNSQALDLGPQPLNTYAPNNSCHRSPHSWQRQGITPGSTTTLGARADSYDPSLNFAFLACTDARAFNVLPMLGEDSLGGPTTTVFGDSVRPQYGMSTQLGAGYLDSNTTLVTLSISGNDLGFPDIIETCLDINFTQSDCVAALDVRTKSRIDDQLGPQLRQIVTEIRRRAPNAKIVLMGYPRLWQPLTNPIIPPDTARRCPWGPTSALEVPLLNEIEWMDQMSTRAHDKMGATVASIRTTDSRVYFSSPVSKFTGRGLCMGLDSAVNGLVTTRSAGEIANTKAVQTLVGVYQESIHPNRAGQTLYSSAYQSTLNAP